MADGQSIDPFSNNEIGFRGRDLQITYTGISLRAPEGVRFRYRLIGHDPDWQDAGDRRSLEWLNLPPGHYQFHVIASNADGTPNEAGAAFRLRVDPYFYQTWSFYLACALSMGLAVWSWHRMRVRRVVGRMQLIAAERDRFSQEIHDSLLQGFTGVVFLLDGAVRQFDLNPGKSKKSMERALDQADQSMREARQMILSMRIPALENSTLAEALRTALEQSVSGMPLDFQFEVRGRPRQQPYEVEANLFLIGCRTMAPVSIRRRQKLKKVTGGSVACNCAAGKSVRRSRFIPAPAWGPASTSEFRRRNEGLRRRRRFSRCRMAAQPEFEQQDHP